MSVVASLGLLAFATAPFAAGELRSAWNLRDHIPLEQIIVQSHRGAGALMPENSLEAFELAWELGTIPEGDLRTTRNRVIKDLRWDEVARLDLGAWKGRHFAGQRVPRTSQICKVLQRHPRRPFCVDSKDPDLFRRLMDLGVASFATDYPDVAMKTIREYYGQPRGGAKTPP